MHLHLGRRKVFDDRLEDDARVDQRAPALGADIGRNLVIWDGVFINGRLGTRGPRMFSLVGLATSLGGFLPCGRLGPGSKALLASQQFELQFGDLSLQPAILGTQLIQLRPHRLDKSLKLLHNGQNVADSAILAIMSLTLTVAHP